MSGRDPRAPWTVRGQRLGSPRDAARPLLAASILVVGCATPVDAPPPPPASAALPASTAPPAPPPARPPPPRVRPQIDGRDFPDKVIALTWDDGPDTGTLTL